MPSQELVILVPLAIKSVIGSLRGCIEQAAGVSLRPVHDLNPAIAERVFSGRRGDIGLSNPPSIRAVPKTGLAG